MPKIDPHIINFINTETLSIIQFQMEYLNHSTELTSLKVLMYASYQEM